MRPIQTYFTKNIVFIAWVIAAGATMTSLVLSEVADLIPCELCWYQRIFMFSAAFVLGVGEHYKDPKVYRYVLPLTVTGGAIALYHTLLQWGIVPQALTCDLTASCATKQLELLGFITIPLLALVTFTALSGLMFLQLRQNSSSK